MEDRNALFQVAYDGPALATHEMNVKDFAPALLALGELLEDANQALNGDRVKIAVNIRATEPGSVDVLLSVAQTLLNQTISLFDSRGVTAFVNAKELLTTLGIGGGAVAGGVIGIIRWLKNRPIKNIVKIDAGEFKMELEDGEARVVTNHELKLFGFLNIRKNIEAVVRTPLSREGIDKVSFVGKDGKHEAIGRDEADFFAAPEVAEETIGETETETSLQIANISFVEGGKWKFSDGNATFFADIVDEDFLEKVRKNETAFAKDDILRVRLGTRQYLVGGGIKADYVVLQVLEHRSAAIQIRLPISMNDADEE